MQSFGAIQSGLLGLSSLCVLNGARVLNRGFQPQKTSTWIQKKWAQAIGPAHTWQVQRVRIVAEALCSFALGGLSAWMAFSSSQGQLVEKELDPSWPASNANFTHTSLGSRILEHIPSASLSAKVFGGVYITTQLFSSIFTSSAPRVTSSSTDLVSVEDLRFGGGNVESYVQRLWLYFLGGSHGLQTPPWIRTATILTSSVNDTEGGLKRLVGKIVSPEGLGALWELLTGKWDPRVREQALSSQAAAPLAIEDQKSPGQRDPLAQLVQITGASAHIPRVIEVMRSEGVTVPRALQVCASLDAQRVESILDLSFQGISSQEEPAMRFVAFVALLEKDFDSALLENPLFVEFIPKITQVAGEWSVQISNEEPVPLQKTSLSEVALVNLEFYKLHVRESEEWGTEMTEAAYFLACLTDLDPTNLESTDFIKRLKRYRDSEAGVIGGVGEEEITLEMMLLGIEDEGEKKSILGNLKIYLAGLD